MKKMRPATHDDRIVNTFERLIKKEKMFCFISLPVFSGRPGELISKRIEIDQLEKIYVGRTIFVLYFFISHGNVTLHTVVPCNKAGA